MKRILSLLLVFTAVAMLIPAAALADFSPEDIPTPRVMLMDADSGAVLFEKDGYEQAFPASTTKILTCIIAIEKGSLDEEYKIENEPTGKGSCMGLSMGERITLRDLLYGMMLVSGNDAAKAIAECIAGSVSDFAVLMNEKAREIGAVNSNFITPNGLHDEEHYSTAYDMALIARYAMQNETFREIVSADTHSVEPTNRDSSGYQLENSNKLIHMSERDDESYKYKYATGIKTGDTNEAGRCLVASAEKDGISLIAVLWGDPQGDSSRYIRFENAAALFDWGFENFTSATPDELGIQNTIIQAIANASLYDEENGSLTINVDLSGKKISGTKEFIEAVKADSAAITTELQLERTLVAPISAGEALGTVTYKYQDETLFSANLTSSRDVAEIGTSDADPSPSPIIAGLDGADGEKSSPLLFWILLVVGILIIAVVARLLVLKHSRKRSRKRKSKSKGAYRVYKR